MVAIFESWVSGVQEYHEEQLGCSSVLISDRSPKMESVQLFGATFSIGHVPLFGPTLNRTLSCLSRGLEST